MRMCKSFEIRAYSVEKITSIIIVKVYSVSSMHHHQSIAKVLYKIIVAESTNMRSVLINLLVDAGLSWDPVAPYYRIAPRFYTSCAFLHNNALGVLSASSI
jgi:hypothetical protein